MNFARRVSGKLQEQALRMREGIVKEISEVVMDKVKTNNLDLVLDKSGMSLNGVPLVMYSRENYDFTSDVCHCPEQTGPRDRAGCECCTKPGKEAVTKTTLEKHTRRKRVFFLYGGARVSVCDARHCDE